MDRETWKATVHGVEKSQTQLSDQTTRNEPRSRGMKRQRAMVGFPGGTSSKEPPCQCKRHKRRGFDPWVRKTPWRRAWQPTPVFLPGESHGQRSLERYSPQGRKESDTAEATQCTCTKSDGIDHSFSNHSFENLINNKELRQYLEEAAESNEDFSV